jgi:vancomycin resistance protein YoaR
MLPRSRSKALSRVRVLAGIALLVAAITLSGGSPASIGGAVFELPTVLVHGEVVAGADAVDRVRAIARGYLEEKVLVDVGGELGSFTRAELGVSVDLESLESLVERALTPDSDVIETFRREGGSGELRLALPVAIDPAPLRRLLVPEKERLDRGARDAYYDFDRRVVIDDRDGRLLDLYDSLAVMIDALHRGETRLTATMLERPAKRRVKDFDGVSFDATLGEFDTRYARTPEAKLRTENLVIAAAKIDKTVLLPGETFDFNEVVGPRTAVNGFKPAPVIAAGEITDGIGGGACQISGTLHAAAVFAGLPIVDRKPHSRPSSYIRMGLDAMVTYPHLNFRFKNDRPFPVAIRMSVENGLVTAKIMGREADRRVTFVRRINEVVPFTEVERKDPSLPAGVQVLSQRGVPGFRNELARILKDAEGNELSTEKREDYYPPTSQIWRVGAGPKATPDFVPPLGDTHAEYRADEYLEMAQGAGIRGTTELKRAGRTGAPGWTEREGMPKATR